MKRSGLVNIITGIRRCGKAAVGSRIIVGYSGPATTIDA